MENNWNSRTALLFEGMIRKTQNRRVLIIDDDAFDSSVIKNSICSCARSVEVFVVNDSTTAVEKFHEIKPDLTLIDISMPEVDGFEVLQSIAPEAKMSGKRVIMLSGSTSVYDRSKSFELGACDYLVKPSNIVDYRKLAKKLIFGHPNKNTSTVARKAFREKFLTLLPRHFAVRIHFSNV